MCVCKIYLIYFIIILNHGTLSHVFCLNVSLHISKLPFFETSVAFITREVELSTRAVWYLPSIIDTN